MGLQWTDLVSSASFSFFAGSVVEMTYGLEIENIHDPLVTNVQKVVEGVTMAAVTVKYLVDIFPVLQHVPDWVPGTGFKQFAKEFIRMNEKIKEEPFNRVVSAMVSN